jgi:hypothetical protein
LYFPEWQPYGKAASPKWARDVALTADFPNQWVANTPLCSATVTKIKSDHWEYHNNPLVIPNKQRGAL